MDNTDRSIEGITSSGRIVSLADYHKAEEKILEILPKFDMGTVTKLAEFACNEHLDGVVLITLTELLAIQLLKLSLQDTLDSAEKYLRTDTDNVPYDFGNAFAQSLRNKVFKLKQATDTFTGYSTKGKNRMVIHTVKHLNGIYAELFEFYQMKYEYIIKDGTANES